ncbi:fumarylacetoacetate hydrolase family protein [Vibrio crassostreae]|uniref:fumarylacetoacetate hydrolase family protein n=1 Tax=Vibrio crassostreae TaxID=246167 RepID=UPI00104D3AC1|nr:fumarylacetoacetate hydrolase family protein [Vibrio crassostreae]TCN95969.1 2-keto-4-pentenoate hydratase/2-oxohepta-3-ene-1,7-dioic acid hydratase in catechol pathway [Vibrio crassostreae]CAK1771074.1 Protein Rv2993c [Vibrio crassostreae]CAK1777179.1 Protein Rv2993c [Vibrio crassostreae]CAK1816294.1 Protein Rv2993c [Vibrio crassostreae]CAK2579588.1 Protein Rv2993c [Vibrio crassostreae]
MKVLMAVLMISSAAYVNAETVVKDSTEEFVRYQYQGKISYGKLDKGDVLPINGDIFGEYSVAKTTIPLESIEVLLPTKPEKVFAVGMNFASHLASPADAPPPMFLKLPSSLILTGEVIQVPPRAKNVHFEGELVVVIGKQLSQASEEEAEQAIFGVTVGNDITERSWQGTDLQWLRAKASDGFGPIGNTIVRGVDYNKVRLTTRVNGEVVQQENTSFMIHKPRKVVSYLSHYFTLKPGDLIFMGTPGRTFALSDKDQVSVTIEGVGTVVNEVRF